MKIENVEVFGFNAAIRAMRNPMNSWHKSDSYKDKLFCPNDNIEDYVLGVKDAELSRKLYKAGTEHCKHLRLIAYYADWTLPLKVWKHIDTYKHTEKISCSTMHRLTKDGINKECFAETQTFSGNDNLDYIIIALEFMIKSYNNTTDKEFKSNLFEDITNLLPDGYLQTRTIKTNYQQLINIYNQRKNHKLKTDRQICEHILTLPYLSELTGIYK